MRRHGSVVEAGVFDILQDDMNNFRFERTLAEFVLASQSGALIAPHNWGSLLGSYMQLHTGRGISNFYRAELDSLACDAIIADGYDIEDGSSSVPDAPGLGLRIDDRRLAAVACVHFDLKT